MGLPRIYTIDDIYALTDDKRAELIDGNIYYMAPLGRKHQRIIGELYATIREYIKSNNGTCEVDIAPFAVFLNADDKNYVEPDISVICDSDKLNDKGCVGAPDWIIEIVSPSSKRMDYFTKLFKYRTAGVKEYWIVDPASLSIFPNWISNANKSVANFLTTDLLLFCPYFYLIWSSSLPEVQFRSTCPRLFH